MARMPRLNIELWIAALAQGNDGPLYAAMAGAGAQGMYAASWAAIQLLLKIHHIMSIESKQLKAVRPKQYP